MIILMLGYFLMGLIFLILRFFYHILPKKSFHDNIIHAVKADCVLLNNYVRQTILSNRKAFKIVAVTMIVLIILPNLPLQIEIEYVIEDFFCTLLFLMLVIVFAPQKKPSRKGFPVEIFGFIYSIIFMY